jgi:hypothetical protein
MGVLPFADVNLDEMAAHDESVAIEFDQASEVAD